MKENYEEKYAAGEIDIPDDLYAVTAVGPDKLWAAGYFGAIYRTSDGGKSWKKLDGHTDQSIYDISFADDKNGWAVGRRGFVIHTTDGGDTWTQQEIPRKPAQHLFAVRAVDANTAWAVGDWGGRYYTADGGKTWEDRSFTLTPESPSWKYLSEEELDKAAKGEKLYDDIFLNDVFFVDPQHGWMAGEYGYIFRTEDGGQTWERAHIKGTVHFDDIAFPVGEREGPEGELGQDLRRRRSARGQGVPEDPDRGDADRRGAEEGRRHQPGRRARRRDPEVPRERRHQPGPDQDQERDAARSGRRRHEGLRADQDRGSAVGQGRGRRDAVPVHGQLQGPRPRPDHGPRRRRSGERRRRPQLGLSGDRLEAGACSRAPSARTTT